MPISSTLEIYTLVIIAIVYPWVYIVLFLAVYCIVPWLLIVLFPGERSVLFSDAVIKVNRRGRTQERWLMITG